MTLKHGAANGGALAHDPKLTAGHRLRTALLVVPAALLSALLPGPRPALAQHSGHSGPTPSAHELHPGLGNYHFPITTQNPQAQVYFDQGIALLYGFNHDEAARYFRRATELDPQAAMPYWGLALSIGPNYNDTAVDAARAQATYDAVQSARARAPGASPRERAYIEAIARRYASPDPNSDWLGFHRDYSNAMREMVRNFPDDLDAATMFAESLMMLRPWQLWTLDGEPAPGTLELVAVLESVLKRNPDHAGANHFYIHSVEASRNLERAIPSATRLMTLMPGAGHLVHMPGHIFLQTGDFELTAATNVKAAEADRVFVARTGATGMYPQMYYTHNVHFIAYARAQQGRYEDAKQAAEQMVAMTGDADLEPRMQMLEGFHLYPLMVDLRFGRWDALAAAPEPAQRRPMSHAFWRYARAMAFAGQGRIRDADREQRDFERERAAVAADTQYLINNKAADVLALAGATLAARIAAARGDTVRTVDELRRAVQLEAAIQYDEPPAWFYPVRQSLGGALLRGGQPREAEAVFRESLARYPRDGRLLFGLWQSLLAQDRPDEAVLVQAQHAAAWKDATVELAIEDL
ncbi:MAG TPA: tetratricopeptide repeat protein [Burkholderiales bacterium]|nr:tetratricopeptide repeat protein [Burkholderiales bacterium]